MKRRKLPKLDIGELTPYLIQFWRKWMKIAGTKEQLQTREFRQVVELVCQLQSEPADFEDPQVGRKLLGAYILYNWQIHYQQGLSILSEVSRAPRSVLDLCSGPAAFGLAAFSHGAEQVLCLDQSETALRAGAQLCGYRGFAPNWQVWQGPLQPLPNQTFDLIILGHSLEELFPIRAMRESVDRAGHFLRAAAQRLRPGGHLLLVESSLPETNSWFLELRDNLVQLGFFVQAPCIWQGACPALASKAPCFAQRQMVKSPFLAEIQRAARINASSLKMSYLLLKAPGEPAPQLARSSPDETFHRVISPPFDSHLGRRFYLCGEGGKKDLGCRLRDETDHRVATFRSMQRGGLYRLQNAPERKGHIEVDANTRFSLASQPGRPIPEGDLSQRGS